MVLRAVKELRQVLTSNRLLICTEEEMMINVPSAILLTVLFGK